MASSPGVASSRKRVLGADIDDFAVLRLPGAVHDPGDLPELAAYLEDHRAGGPTDGADGQAREQEDHGGAKNQSHKGLRREDDGLVDEPVVALSQHATDGVGVGAEESGRGKHGGGDRDALW